MRSVINYLTATCLSMLMHLSSASALDAEAARSHVMDVAQHLIVIAEKDYSLAERREKIRDLLEEKTALKKIARFTLGREARNVSEEQLKMYERAFADYLANSYANRFSEYKGEKVVFDKTRDLGRKGILVVTYVRGNNRNPILLEWRVSDRGGKVLIIDLTVEGVSLLVTQRQEIISKLELYNNDIDRLINDLKATGS